MLLDYLKTLPQYLLPKHGLTALAGYLADLKKPWIKNQLIRYFIRKYQVDMREALEENPEHYACFNDFFIRHLKPECRPIATADIVSPVDGYISEIGQIKAGQLLQAKGKQYSVQELLACSTEQSAQFENGCFATLYLSPKDYHRIHMPLEGTLKEMVYMPGSLFSVQPSTVRVIPKLFARNERVAAFFDTNAGPMAMVLVGATIVGGIATSWHGDVIRSSTQAHFSYSQESIEPLAIEKAAEMGYFKLGSTVVLLFAHHHHVQWLENWRAGDRILLGQALGSINISPT